MSKYYIYLKSIYIRVLFLYDNRIIARKTETWKNSKMTKAHRPNIYPQKSSLGGIPTYALMDKIHIDKISHWQKPTCEKFHTPCSLLKNLLFRLWLFGLSFTWVFNSENFLPRGLLSLLAFVRVDKSVCAFIWVSFCLKELLFREQLPVVYCPVDICLLQFAISRFICVCALICVSFLFCGKLSIYFAVGIIPEVLFLLLSLQLQKKKK